MPAGSNVEGAGFPPTVESRADVASLTFLLQRQEGSVAAGGRGDNSRGHVDDAKALVARIGDDDVAAPADGNTAGLIQLRLRCWPATAAKPLER